MLPKPTRQLCEDCDAGCAIRGPFRTACVECSEARDPGGPNADLLVTLHQVLWKSRLVWANLQGAHTSTVSGGVEDERCW